MIISTSLIPERSLPLLVSIDYNHLGEAIQRRQIELGVQSTFSQITHNTIIDIYLSTNYLAYLKSQSSKFLKKESPKAVINNYILEN